MIIVTAAEMRAADEATVSLSVGSGGGIDSYRLMERAGAAVAAAVRARVDKHAGKLLFVCGGGNNGGDAFVAATIALAEGYGVRLLCQKAHATLVGDAARAAEAFVAAGGSIEALSGSALQSLEHALATTPPAVIVDGLFGTGFVPPAREPAAELIRVLNRVRERVGCLTVSIDIPSGVDADRGEVGGEVFRADLTVCLQALKPALLLLPAAEFAGEVRVADIGVDLDHSARKVRELFTAQAAAQLLPRSPLYASGSHKGSRGHVMVIGGGPGHYGAPRLTAEAALRSGAGLVTLAIPAGAAKALAFSLTELMCVGLPEDEQGGFSGDGDLTPHFLRKQALVLGPGIGTSVGAARLVERVFSEAGAVPLVIDADALNVLAAHPGLCGSIPPGSVLTPHPTEMARLLGRSTAEVQQDRFAAATEAAAAFGAVVVLKGARSVVADPAGALFINPTAEAALGTAGSGDLLAGIIAALLGQGYSALQAAQLGVFLHGAAGELAVEDQGSPWGIVASDFGRAIGHAVKRILRDAKRWPSEFDMPILPTALSPLDLGSGR